MSLHLSLISIPGNAKEALESFFIECEYKYSSPSYEVKSLDALFEVLKKPEDKGVVYKDSFTTIIDLELVLMLDEEPLKEISIIFNSVLAVICEGASDTYGFVYFEKGEKIRSYAVCEGDIIDDLGSPLQIEKDISLEKLSENSVLEILGRFGVAYSSLNQAESFEVHHLEFNEEIKDELVKVTKPWWKIW